MEVTVPVWLINNVGGLVGCVVLSKILLKIHKQKKRDREQKEQDDRDREQEKRDDHLRSLQEKEQLRDSLLPGPWRELYNFFHESESMSRQSILLSVKAFKRNADIPPICPRGFDILLEVSYYDIGGEGSCHNKFVEMLGDYVKFPTERK